MNIQQIIFPDFNSQNAILRPPWKGNNLSKYMLLKLSLVTFNIGVRTISSDTERGSVRRMRVLILSRKLLRSFACNIKHFCYSCRQFEISYVLPSKSPENLNVS